jgi:membrane protease YdiL (CAAX protease family)
MKGINIMNDSQRKKTIWYIVIFCVLVTAVAFTSPLLGGSPSSIGPGFILWGAAPLLVVLLLRIVTRDWSDAGLKPALKKYFRWYMLAIFTFPILMVLTLFIGDVISVSSFSGFSIIPFLKTFLPSFVMFFFFAVCEEFGWRGYLVPKLASLQVNNYLSYIVVGVVWAVWHLPFITQIAWIYSTEELVTFIPRFFIAMITFAILYHEIRIITGSVWPAVLMHCLMNAFGHPLMADYVTITAGKEYLISNTGLFMIFFVGLLGIAINRWRVRKDRR